MIISILNHPKIKITYDNDENVSATMMKLILIRYFSIHNRILYSQIRKILQFIRKLNCNLTEQIVSCECIKLRFYKIANRCNVFASIRFWCNKSEWKEETTNWKRYYYAICACTVYWMLCILLFYEWFDYYKDFS